MYHIYIVVVSFLVRIILGGLELGKNNARVVAETLRSLRWRVGLFSFFKESCIINF